MLIGGGVGDHPVVLASGVVIAPLPGERRAAVGGFEEKSGKQLWTANINLGSRYRALGDRLLTIGANGEVTAYRADGTRAWAISLGCRSSDWDREPIKGAGTLGLFWCSGRQIAERVGYQPARFAPPILIAVDLVRGVELWRRSEEDLRGGTVTTDGVDVVVAWQESSSHHGPTKKPGRITSLSAKDGRTRWSVEGWPMGTLVLLARDAIISTGFPTIRAYARSDGRLLWSRERPHIIPDAGLHAAWTEARLTQDQLLIANGGQLEAWSASTGKTTRSWPFPAVALPHVHRRAPFVVRMEWRPEGPLLWLGTQLDTTALAQWREGGWQFLAMPHGTQAEHDILFDTHLVSRHWDGSSDHLWMLDQSLADPAPPEASLSAAERVQALLTRARFPTSDLVEDARQIPQVATHLLTIAQDPTAAKRRLAIWMLGRLGAPQALQPLLAMYRHTSAARTSEPPAHDAKGRAQVVEAGLRGALVVALAQYDDAEAARELSHVLREPYSVLARGEFIHAAVYRMLQRTQRGADALQRFEQRTEAPRGWKKLCQVTDRESVKYRTFRYGSPCNRAAAENGDLRIANAGLGLWGRVGGNGRWSSPFWVSAQPLGTKLSIRKLAGDRVVVKGEHAEVEFPLDDARRDSDRDGIPDTVEEMLGTDPSSSDTDADGVLDGDDPAPLIRPTSSEAGEVRRAALFYATRFSYRTRDAPLLVLQGEGPDEELAGVAPVVLRCPRPEQTGDAAHRRCHSRRLGEPALYSAATVIDVGRTEVKGDTASVEIRFDHYDARKPFLKLGLQRWRGRWRVVDSPSEWDELPGD